MGWLGSIPEKECFSFINIESITKWIGGVGYAPPQSYTNSLLCCYLITCKVLKKLNSQISIIAEFEDKKDQWVGGWLSFYLT